jgi:hypothetical protein
MKNTIQKKVQVGLIGIILVLASTGCAQLNKESKKTQATEPGQASVAEAKPTTSVDTTPPIEEEAQALQSSDTTPPIEEEAQALQRPTPFVHTVQWPRETLSIIAKWYTGKFENWKALMDANPKLQRNRMSIGSKILIPEDFLKTQESMPQEFLAKFAPKRKNKATPFVHTVQWPRETLSIIAKWYTGKFKNWKALVDANPKLKPNRIFIGSKILIPEDFLKTRESMPLEFLAKFTSKKKKKASPSTPPPEEEQEPDLIGPKEYPER